MSRIWITCTIALMAVVALAPADATARMMRYGGIGGCGCGSYSGCGEGNGCGG